MLPGFRFLFAAIILSMSILIFGLGAAALLRAAHEEVASNPSWHAAPEATFAQPGETARADASRPEASRPVLAMLRVDTPVIEKPSGEVAAAAAPDVPAAAAPEPAVIPPAPAEPEKIATLRPEDASPPEPVKPEIAVPESPKQEKPEIPVSGSPAQDVAASAPANPAASVDENKIAAAAEALSPANQAPAAEVVPAAPAPPDVAASPEAARAATRIATLGGPPVSIKTEAQPRAKAAAAKPDARPDRSVIKKQLRARQANHRRRIAARARVARQVPAQPVDPFAQPAPPARTR